MFIDSIDRVTVLVYCGFYVNKVYLPDLKTAALERTYLQSEKYLKSIEILHSYVRVREMPETSNQLIIRTVQNCTRFFRP